METVKDLVKGLFLMLLFALIVFLTGKNKITIPFVLLLYYIGGLKTKNYKQLFLLILPILIIMIVYLFDESSLKSVAILYLFFIPIVSFIGYHFNRRKLIIKILFPVLFIPIGGIFYPNWFNFYENKEARVNLNTPEIKLKTEMKDDVRLDSIKNKIIVLDFWTTSCGVCFKKFPEYERVFLEYKDNPRVQFYAVNIPLKKETVDSNIAFANEKVNYQFQNLYAESMTLADSLGFNAYPHLIILKNGNIRYSGKLITDTKIYNIRREIDRLLKE
ncbi:MAG: TlpA disulfide reductase family protein [Flavobacteriaceae bacterium]